MTSLEFLPDSWELKTINEIGDLHSGSTPSTRVAAYWNGEIVWITPNDLSKLNTRFINSSERTITYQGLKHSSAKLLPARSLVISSRAPIGYLALPTTEFCTNQGCKTIVFGEEQEPEFHYYNFSFRVRKIREKGEGTTFAEISKTALGKIEFPVPKDRHTQTKIAEVLTAVDQAITQTESLIAKYQRIKTGLMQDLLTRGIDENGNLRDPATHEFKEVEGYGRIPQEWEYTYLGKCIELHNHLRKPISATVREGMKGPFPYYGATGVVDYINEYRVEGEYILMGEDGDHFLKYLEQEMTLIAKGKFNVSNHAHIIKGTPKCANEWIHHFFSHRDITYHLTRQGAGRYKLNKATLLSLPIVLPKPNEQEAISKLLFSMQKTIDSYTKQLAKIRRVKTGLMQDLLTGKVSIAPLLNSTEEG